MMKAQRGQQGGKKQKPKMQPMKKALDVTLEQLCKGKSVNYFQERARTCEKCEGRNQCDGMSRVQGRGGRHQNGSGGARNVHSGRTKLRSL